MVSRKLDEVKYLVYSRQDCVHTSAFIFASDCLRLLCRRSFEGMP
jgi:hypothetical protein